MSNSTVVNTSRHYARLLLMMRRLVKEEFAVTVRLEDEEAPEELLAFASRSRHHLLRQMAIELEEQLGVNTTEVTIADAAPVDEKVTYYRGAPVVRENVASSDPLVEQQTSKRVYRGQVIG